MRCKAKVSLLDEFDTYKQCRLESNHSGRHEILFDGRYNCILSWSQDEQSVLRDRREILAYKLHSRARKYLYRNNTTQMLRYRKLRDKIYPEDADCCQRCDKSEEALIANGMD